MHEIQKKPSPCTTILLAKTSLYCLKIKSKIYDVHMLYVHQDLSLQISSEFDSIIDSSQLKLDVTSVVLIILCSFNCNDALGGCVVDTPTFFCW